MRSVSSSAILTVLLSTIIPVLGASMSKTVLYQAPDECRWSGYSESDIVLVCRLRTINSELENTNFSVIQPQNTIRLRLECNDQLFFQSSLSPGSFRALVELRSLAIEYCKLANLTDGAFKGLDDLQNLTIRTHNAVWSSMSLDISPSVFNDFRQLERLDLSQNNIWQFPDGMLCPLKKLNYFNMSNNRIQDISSLHFSVSLSNRKSRVCGTTLDTLDLSYNKITNLPAAIFSALGHLKTLRLKRNNMNFIADRAFEGLASLTSVDLSENGLTNLPPELFSETRYLSEIYLNNNSINVLAPGLFADLTELLILDISNNELNSQWINANTFIGLKRLVLLDLSNNRITKLEMNIFKGLGTLQILRMQDNFIDSIPENTFIELTNLHTLVMSNNRLTTVESNTLRGLYGIQVLSLDYNRISRVDPLALKNCSTLEDLHLNGNKLMAIPDVLHYVPMLKTLDLGENHISSIDNSSFRSLEQLFGLRLTENNIDYIKRGVFDRMTSLQILNLSRNKIKTMEPGVFHKNTQLQAIRLDGNYLKSIDGIFNDLNALVWLNMSDNHLETFDYSQIPGNLQWLDIHANKLVQLGNYIGLENELLLSTFDASANRLTEITASSIPNSIETLYLNNNEISKIQSYTFFKKPNLTRVELIGNKITTLDPNALRLSPVLDELPLPEFYIGNNPFLCDCNLDWLQKTNIESRTQPKLMDLTNVNCKLLFNRDKSAVPLIEAKSTDFLCKYETHCFTLCHCCNFYACDCKMECPSGCTCYHDQSWASNVVDCSNAGYQKKLPLHIPMESTQLYLDGNDFGVIESHAFIGRKKLRILFLNHSNIEEIRNRTFYGLQELEILQLDHNNIQRLHGNEFQGLENLRELYLQNNRIETVDNFTFGHLHHLKILRIDHNAIFEFTFWNLPPYLNELRLSSNPWSCDCQLMQKFRDYINRYDYVQDRMKIRCNLPVNNSEVIISTGSGEYDNEVPGEGFLIYLNNQTQLMSLCAGLEQLENVTQGNLTSTKTILTPQPIQDYIPFLVAILSGFLIVIIFTLLIFIFRQEMRVWFHSKFGIRLFSSGKDFDKSDRDKLFDAFISYSSKDEAFVAEDLAPMLENGDPSYKLCLHYRDFPVGAYIADTIVQAIESSKRTIMILSENFIKSEWCRFEFKSAHHQVLRDRRKRLIVILLGEVPQKELDPDIRLYLKTNTYLQWGDKLFWEKLRFALPDVPNNQRRLPHCNFTMAAMPPNPNCTNPTSVTTMLTSPHSRIPPGMVANGGCGGGLMSSTSSTGTNSTDCSGGPGGGGGGGVVGPITTPRSNFRNHNIHNGSNRQNSNNNNSRNHSSNQMAHAQQQSAGHHGRNSSPRTVAIHI